MPLQPIIPTWLALNGCNDASASGITDKLGFPIYAGGLDVGDYFDLTEQQANSLSNTDMGILHWGRYRRVKVHEDATPENIVKGKVGLIVPALAPELNIVTSADQGVAIRRAVVFLNPVDPGRYTFVQEYGVASVLINPTNPNVNLGGTAYVSADMDGTISTIANTDMGFGFLLATGTANDTIPLIIHQPVVQG